MGGDRAGKGGGGALSRSVWTPSQVRWCPPPPPAASGGGTHAPQARGCAPHSGGGLARSVAQGRARPRPQGWHLPEVSPHQSCCLLTPKWGSNTTPLLPAFPLSQAWLPPAVPPCGRRAAGRQWRSPEVTGSPFGAASCARGSSTKRSPSGTRTLIPRGLSCECKYWKARTSTKVKS